MVESLKELNSLCQKPQYKEVGNWMVRKILRPAALPLTWVFLHTSITANQVTLLALGVGVLGLLLFVSASKAVFLTGSLFLQLWYLLDHVDGQIARYRKTACLTGRFYDFMMHHIIHGIFFFTLSIYVYGITQNVIFLYWGFIISFSMTSFNLIQDSKCKTFIERLLGLSQIKIAPAQPARESKTEGSLFRKVYSTLHKASEIHVLVNIFTAAAILNLMVPGDLRFSLFVGYGLAVPFLFISKLTYFIHTKKIDQEFEATFIYEKN